MLTKLLIDEIQVTNRLEAIFDVTKEQLTEVVYAGVAGRNECTANHPKQTPGIRCWADATRALRDLLCSKGWARETINNVACVVNTTRNITLAVCNTDIGTGLEYSSPQPIRSKGDGTKRLIYQNQPVFPMFETYVSAPSNESAGFWYLCIYCGEQEIVRAELVRLAPLTAEGDFDELTDRILIIGEDGGDGPTFKKDIQDGPQGDLEINVTRRVA